LVIGSYSPNMMAAVGTAAVLSYLVAHWLQPPEIGIVAPDKAVLVTHDLILAVVLGLLAALVGIILLRGGAFCETLSACLAVRPTWRTMVTMVGGGFVGILAIVSPQVMSDVAGALRVIGTLDLSVRTIAIIFLLKIAASIASLGLGFRGGMLLPSVL